MTSGRPGPQQRPDVQRPDGPASGAETAAAAGGRAGRVDQGGDGRPGRRGQGRGARELLDRRGGRWQLGNQGRVDMLLAAHSMNKIETLYGTVFEDILGEKISTRPVEVVTPFPWVNARGEKAAD